jgi:hypothetical protein
MCVCVCVCVCVRFAQLKAPEVQRDEGLTELGATVERKHLCHSCCRFRCNRFEEMCLLCVCLFAKQQFLIRNASFVIMKKS